MRLLRPDLAGWLLVVPVAIAAWIVYVQYKRHARRRSGIGIRRDSLSRLSGHGRDAAVLVLGSLALGALAFALLRPQARLELREPEYERYDLILLLDRSISMRARDVDPSRFVRATQEIKNFLRKKPESIDRVGLVGFAATPVVLSYLTRDVESLFFYLDWIEQDPQALFGTDIGAALESARDVARRDRQPTRKIFLLVSDGEDRGAQLARMLSLFRGERQAVHTIGIGTEDDVLVPAMQAGGVEKGVETFLRDDDGRMLTTRFDETTLKGIAVATGGRYARSQSGHELAAALDAVVAHERRLVGWRTSRAYRELYRVGLAVAAAAACGLLLVL